MVRPVNILATHRMVFEQLLHVREEILPGYVVRPWLLDEAKEPFGGIVGLHLGFPVSPEHPISNRGRPVRARGGRHSGIYWRNRDTAWFAAIDSEWSSLKEAFEAWLAPSNFDDQGQQRESLSDLTRLVRVASDPLV